ncbi:MAG: Rho termination factor N-terminal domain-containing protein, partial [Stackebrandtia sp.]
MSDTTGITPEAASGVETAAETRRRRGGSGLASMLMPELQQLANSLGITGIGRMRKSELITAIQASQSSKPQSEPASAAPKSPSVAAAQDNGAEEPAAAGRATRAAGPPQPRRTA